MGFGRQLRRALMACLVGALAVGVIASARATASEGCDNAPLPDAPTLKVLVFGDSLTAGSAGDYTWRYRYWQQQRAAGVNVDFLGPINGMGGTRDYPYANNEAYADPCFTEREHWAIGGKKLESTFQPPWWLSTTPGAPTEIEWAVRTYAPDVVVEFMGGNDLAKAPTVTPEQLVDEARAFVEEVRKADPATEVAIATTTTNLVSSGENYNSLVKQQAPTWSTAESKVGVIDVMRDWQGTADTWDGYHPHARGEMHLAWDVADGLSALGFGAAPPRPIPSVPIGPRTPPELTLAGQSATSVTLGWTSPIGADREIVWGRDVTTGAPWEQLGTIELSAGVTIPDLAPDRYDFRIQAAKGAAVAEDLYSPVVSADLSGPQPTATTTPTQTATASPTASATPTQTATSSATPSTTPSATPTATPTLLGRVSALSGTPNYHAVLLNWAPVGGSTGYTVTWHATDSTATSSLDAGGTSVAITGLVAGQPYAFEVRARRSGSVGPAGPEIVVTPNGTVTQAPPRPSLSRVHGHRVRIRWEAAVDATRYQILVRRPGRGWSTLGWATGTRHVTPRLRVGVRYAFRVQPWHQLIPGHTSPAARISVR